MRTLIHLSDLHFGRVDPRIVTPLLDFIRATSPDLVAISGDLTQRARTSELESGLGSWHVDSEPEQKVRFLKRIDEKEKNWKFSSADALERRHWEEYMAAYEDMLTHTSTDWAPWFVVPADHKWFTRLCVSEIVVATLKSLGLKYPKIGDEQLAELQKAKEELLNEK
jgi:3',5'-cyclic AMP phosphodiesterase CpdA